MTGKLVYLLVIGIFGLLSSTQICAQHVSNQLILKINPENKEIVNRLSTSRTFGLIDLDSLFSTDEINEVRSIGKSNNSTGQVLQLSFNEGVNVEGILPIYQSTGLFEYVELNHLGFLGGYSNSLLLSPSDNYFSRQYGFFNDGTFSLSPATEDADIDMDLAWSVEQGDESIVVAILDTGVKLDHPEFDGRIWSNENEILDGLDNDNNGYVDDVNGWDFVNRDNDPSDDSGHGTNVAGIIGANGNNSIGYAGVDWHCKLMICKIVDEEKKGLYSDWAAAIYYAVDNGADVINMSVGGIPVSRSFEEAVDYAYNNGVVVVASMMNDGENKVYYPAAYDNTIAVGATDPNDERSSAFLGDESQGSNFGEHIDVVAPGNYIYGLDFQTDNNYDKFWGGTSQAAPLVSGLCALLLAQDPTRTPDEIRSIIRDYAEDQIGDLSEDKFGFDHYYGYGRINAYHALNPNVVGIENDLKETPEFKLYPNPASDYTTIEIQESNIQIRLIDKFGRVVINKETLNAHVNVRLELGNLSRGLYIVQVINSQKHTIKSEKLLLR